MADGDIRVDVGAGSGEYEIGRQDADRFERLLIQLDGAAYDPGRAMELASP
jgi:hypothetical protein